MPLRILSLFLIFQISGLSGAHAIFPNSFTKSMACNALLLTMRQQGHRIAGISRQKTYDAAWAFEAFTKDVLNIEKRGKPHAKPFSESSDKTKSVKNIAGRVEGLLSDLTVSDNSKGDDPEVLVYGVSISGKDKVSEFVKELNSWGDRIEKQGPKWVRPFFGWSLMLNLVTLQGLIFMLQDGFQWKTTDALATTLLILFINSVFILLGYFNGPLADISDMWVQYRNNDKGNWDQMKETLKTGLEEKLPAQTWHYWARNDLFFNYKYLKAYWEGAEVVTSEPQGLDAVETIFNLSVARRQMLKKEERELLFPLSPMLSDILFYVDEMKVPHLVVSLRFHKDKSRYKSSKKKTPNRQKAEQKELLPANARL